ncbi:major facilitator superfamily domain-containing protein [Spinellus fusiger]|nr:major facilitator superfamily domain-containing protein [Spinellus fusiger]
MDSPHKTVPVVDESTHLLASESGTAKPKAESWSDLRPYLFPILTTNFVNILGGLNDGAFGVMIPRLKHHYDISNGTVSLLFLFNAIGFFISGISNGYIVKTIGQRATIYVAGFSLLFTYSIAATGMPFHIMLFLMMFQGGSIALLDAAVNVYTAKLPMATFMLNILHACYGVGAMISPIVSTMFLVRGITWQAVYVFLGCVAILNLVSITIGFRNVELDHLEDVTHGSDDQEENSPKSTLYVPSHPIRNPVTILIALYILIYVGVEIVLGGWGYTFLTEGRHGDKAIMGNVTAGYWAGLAIGRLLLGYLAGRCGEKRTVSALTLASVLAVIVFGLSESVVVDSIALVTLGFLIGPMFPTSISLASQVLPRSMHATSIGFITAIGASGAAVLPFFAGVIADKFGIQTIPAVCLAMLVGMEIMWYFVPSPESLGIPKKT